MYTYLKNSLIVGVFNTIKPLYKQSMLNKASMTVSSWYKNSITFKAVEKYLTRESTAKASLSYRMLAAVCRSFDGLADRLRGPNGSYLNQSLLSKGYSTFKNGLTNDFNGAAGVFALTVAIGYGMVLTLREQWNPQRLGLAAVLFLFALCLLALKTSLIACVKNSALYRLMQYILD